MSGTITALAVSIVALLLGGSEAKPSAIFTVLIDDLGYSDTQIGGRNPKSPTPTLGQLAKEGVVLTSHYVYKYCSPTRRAILSGRFPNHLNPGGNGQAPVCSNYLPIDATLISEKLRSAGFGTHFIGKGHLGYQTTDHLPINRGFDSHVGYLQAAEQYEHGLMWVCNVPEEANLPGDSNPQNGKTGVWPWKPYVNGSSCHSDFWANHTDGRAVVKNVWYSTNFFADRAIEIIDAQPQGEALYIHLNWQAMHVPYAIPPGWEGLQPSDKEFAEYCTTGIDPPPRPGMDPGTEQQQYQHARCDYGSMLKVVDAGMRNVTAAIRANGLWEDGLMIVSADNGGVMAGNNWPWRGEKLTAWEGGTRVAAFVTGGFVPSELRGTHNSAQIHIVDWYPTICTLVSVDATDTIVGTDGQPKPIDGINVWPLLLSGATESPREYLPTTENSIIYQARWKLLTNAPMQGWYPGSGVATTGLGPDHRWGNSTGGASGGPPLLPDPAEWPCVEKPVAPYFMCNACSTDKPCLFDLKADPAERVNLASSLPAMVKQLAAQLATYAPYVAPFLNESQLTERNMECVSINGTSCDHFDMKTYATCNNFYGIFQSPYWGNYSGPCCRRKA
jgi:arylsulfatase B